MKKPIAILEQFVDNGRIITYMHEFLGRSDCPRPIESARAIFYVYDKKKMNFWQKIFDFGRYKKFLSRKMIASQVNSLSI